MSDMTLHSSHDALRLRGFLYALAGAIAFSGKAILAKLLYKLGADAFAVVGLRMAMALPMFAFMVWWSGRVSAIGAAPSPLTRTERWQVMGLGFCGYYLASTLDFLGLQYISASLERAILYLNPTIVLLLSLLLFKQKVLWQQVLATLLSYFGVALVWLHDWHATSLVAAAAHGMSAGRALTLGSALVLGSAVAYAVYLMGSGRLVQKIGAMRLVGLASCAASSMCLLQWLAVYGFSHGHQADVAHLPWQAWALSGVNAVVCTVLPIWMVMQGVALLGAPAAAQVGMVGPLSTIWMASMWLGEPITLRLLAGTGIVLLGIVILSRAGAKPVLTLPTRLVPSNESKPV